MGNHMLGDRTHADESNVFGAMLMKQFDQSVTYNGVKRATDAKGHYERTNVQLPTTRFQHNKQRKKVVNEK